MECINCKSTEVINLGNDKFERELVYKSGTMNLTENIESKEYITNTYVCRKCGFVFKIMNNSEIEKFINDKSKLR
ncbi:MAG: hypothetical protein JXO44_10320 [Clostridia bacterium]|nr:hypothetical protein [Clostridia bacterium]